VPTQHAHHKITRKELKHDSFMEWTARATDYLQENYVRVAVVVIAIVAVAFGIRMFQAGRVKAAQKASYMFYQGVAELASGNYAGARQTLQQVRDEFRGSPVARETALALAQAQAAAGDNDAALSTLDQALGSVSASDALRVPLLRAKAATLDALKRPSEAEAIYRDLLARQDLSPQNRYDVTMAYAGSLQDAKRYKDAADLLAALQADIDSGKLEVQPRDLDTRLRTLRALAG
jgi:tetratricopeptide (TPR) repeat protein